MSTARRIFDNTTWSIGSKLFTAVVQFVSIPLLLQAYGKEQYGLIVLAMSLNVYLQVLMLGMPHGLVKFVAQWIGADEYDSLNPAVRTGMTLYLMLGLINGLLLAVTAHFSGHLFKIDPSQAVQLKQLIYVSAVMAFVAFPASFIEQLLSGAEEIAWLSRLQIYRRILMIALIVFVYIKPEVISLTVYFILQNALMFIFMPFMFLHWGKYTNLAQSLIPGFQWKKFAPVFKYSILIFSMGILQISFRQLRPIIVGARVDSAATALVDYNIINYISEFPVILSMCVAGALIPAVSRLFAQGQNDKIKNIVTNVTKLTWVVYAMFVLLLILFSQDIIDVYVGSSYFGIVKWLQLLLVSVSVNLYLGPISAVVLGIGKIKPITIQCLFNVPFSLALAFFLTPVYGIGGVVIATLCYNCIVFIFYHIYYLPKVLDCSYIYQILYVFLPPVLIALFSGLIVHYGILAFIDIPVGFLRATIGGVAVCFVYGALTLSFYVRPAEISGIVAKIRK